MSDIEKTIAELNRLHAAATPGEMSYGVRSDATIWFSIGDPKSGPHIQGDVEIDEGNLKYLTSLHKAWPAIAARLASLPDAIQEAREGESAVVNVGYAIELVKLRARMKREGAAEWIEATLELRPACIRPYMLAEDTPVFDAFAVDYLETQLISLRAESGSGGY